MEIAGALVCTKSLVGGFDKIFEDILSSIHSIYSVIGWVTPFSLWAIEISLQLDLVVWERYQITKNLLFGDSKSEKLVFKWVGVKMAQLFQIECWKIISLLKYYSIFNMVDEYQHYVRHAEVH